jgi:membrane associated rhomboid family serine protease
VNDEQKHQQNQPVTGSQPIFLLPGVVTALLGLLVAVHIAAGFLDPIGQAQLTFWFGFFPLRIVASQSLEDWLPLLWTPVTHAFLHAGWEHLLINAAWLAIFATPVARRYGSLPTVAIFLIAAAAGAAAFAVTSLYSNVFLIGASGGVAGLTGAAVRFIFQPLIVAKNPETGERMVLGRRLARFGDVFRNPRTRWFTIVWVGLNAAVPLLPVLGGGEVAIAWQAHLGGFAAGFLLVPLFERRRGHG